MCSQYESWDVKRPTKIDSVRLGQFEATTNKSLPESFLAWLRSTNGAGPIRRYCSLKEDYGDVRIHHVFGLNEGPDYCQLDVVNKLVAGQLGKELIAFADDDIGNIFAISMRSVDFGAVFYWDHETGETVSVAVDMDAFDRMLMEADPNAGDLEALLRADDVERLREWLKEKDINEKGKYDRSLLENAAIYRSVHCIKVLHELGALPFNSKQIAQENLKHFPEHQETVDLLDELY